MVGMIHGNAVVGMPVIFSDGFVTMYDVNKAPLDEGKGGNAI